MSLQDQAGSQDEAGQPKQPMLDPGVYVNLFEVILHKEEADVMATARKHFPDLRELRAKLRNLDVSAYAWEDTIFGYGAQADSLSGFGFTRETITLREHPRLAERMIMEGYVRSLEAAGYTCWWEKGVARAHQFTQALFKAPAGVRLYRGFELRGQFLRDAEQDRLAFGIVIDAVFAYRDQDDQPLSVADIVSRFGNETLKQLRQRQGELSPSMNINLEVSRQRLLRQTLPFVEARGCFTLPCGVEAELSHNPTRVVLVGGVVSE